MRYCHLLVVASTALAALQVDYTGLGSDRQYYKGMNIRAQHLYTPENSSGFKKYEDRNFAFSRLRNMTQDFNAVRTYSTQDLGINHLESIFPLALIYELNILVGLYLDSGSTYTGYTGQDRFQTEFTVLKEAVARFKDLGILHNIIGIMVGNEDMYENMTTPDTIALEINQVKDWLEHEMNDTCTPVGHTDTWNALVQIQSAPVIEASDFLVANIFPYWENVPIEEAKDQFARAVSNLTVVTNSSAGKPIWLGETGWPRIAGSEAATLPNAQASVNNMQTYWAHVGCEVLNNMNAFWYIDEDAGEEQYGRPTWGIWNNGQPVIDLSCNDTKSMAFPGGANIVPRAAYWPNTTTGR